MRLRRLSLYRSPAVWQRSFRGGDFLINQQIRNKICLVALFSSDWDEMGKLCKGFSMDALHQILINFAKQFQPLRNKNYPWQPCFVSDQDKIRKLYKVTSTDAPYRILIHLAMSFQKRPFLNVSVNQKQVSSMDSDTGKNKGPFTDASIQN